MQEHLVILDRKNKNLERLIRRCGRKIEFKDVYDGSFWEKHASKSSQDFFRECARKDFEQYQESTNKRDLENHLKNLNKI